MSDTPDVVLDVQDLNVRYFTPRGDVRAVDGVTFQVRRGRIMGLVGESGCGKTTTAMAILQMVPPPGSITGGAIVLNGKDLTRLSGEALRRIRWTELSLIPQGAMNSLNPVTRISEQMQDAVLAHRKIKRKQDLDEMILEMLRAVGLPDRTYRAYAHELSGGMKQRVAIAMAALLKPDLVIADEPTSALDVVVQRLVAQVLMDVKERLGLSMVIIGHDMGLIAQLCTDIAVMYAGKVVETGSTEDIFLNPLHPYTKLLIDSIPSIRHKKELVSVSATTHSLLEMVPHCIFFRRCSRRTPGCERPGHPGMMQVSATHRVACYLYEGTNGQ